MDELISRKAVIEIIENNHAHDITLIGGDAYTEGYCDGIKVKQSDILEDLAELPSAEPKIIRCKDCKHWIPYDWMFSEMWQSKNIADYPEDEIGCALSDMAMKASDFCSRAERREVTT